MQTRRTLITAQVQVRDVVQRWGQYGDAFAAHSAAPKADCGNARVVSQSSRQRGIVLVRRAHGIVSENQLAAAAVEQGLELGYVVALNSVQNLNNLVLEIRSHTFHFRELECETDGNRDNTRLTSLLGSETISSISDPFVTPWDTSVLEFTSSSNGSELLSECQRIDTNRIREMGKIVGCIS